MSLLPVGFGSAADDDYEITDSLRFRSSASAYLSRTPASAGNRKTWTWNSWLKPSNVGQRRYLFSAGTNSGTAIDAIEFNTDSLRAFSYNGSFVFNISTNALFRDPSAWYMITVTFDSTQAVSSDRAKLYVNGVQQTLAGTTYPSLNATTNFINNSSPHYIGTGILTNYLDGYLTEVNFIDGQALAPTDFGEFDANGTWKAKKYSGTYGTNGFYLPMKPTTQAELQNTVTFNAGTSVSKPVVGVGFSPDLVWFKARSNAQNHYLVDSVRGGNSFLYSSATSAENTSQTWISSFDADGFTATNQLLSANYDYVGWCWDAGDNQPSTGHSSVLYRGSGAAQSIKGFGFSPDLILLKDRSTSSPLLIDSVRGAHQELQPNSTGAETSNSGTRIASIDADGFSLANTAVGGLNGSGKNYVAWGWDAGDGDPVTNTTGDINSTVKASDTTGVSVVSYTGNGTSNSEQTIGHGLSTAPKVVIVKNRTSASTRWSFYSTDLSSDGTYAVKNLLLNTTSAESAYSSQIRGIQGSNTFSVRDVDANGNANVNKSGDNYMAYCFSEVSGVSKFGTYPGNGSSNGPTVTGLGFRPGFVLVKGISTGQGWTIWDSTRGPFNTVTESLSPGSSSAESNFYTVDFNDDGFQLKSSYSVTNQSGQTYLYMAFKGSYSDHVSPLNDDGSIVSRVKANTSKGFSIVSYEGTGGATDTIGHGLSSAPEMVIVKDRDAGNFWSVYHVGVDATAPEDYLMRLNTTNARLNGSVYWNDTAPTSSVFTVGTSSALNDTHDYIAYCFHSVTGYSKFASYTGTGSAGKAITGLGFQPAWLMIKETTSTGSWAIVDTTRSPNYDAQGEYLWANLSSATGGASAPLTFDSDGFTINSGDSDTNSSGQTYIYMAFADTADAVFNFDASGNKNNFDANNINSNGESETTYDLMKDTPSLVDENAGNFCTMNALNGLGTLSEGNMTVLSTVANWESRGGTIAVSSGKWYWEADVITVGSYMQVGMVGTDVFFQATDVIQEWATGYGYYSYNGNKSNNGSHSSYGATYTTGDLIGIALDLDAGTIEFYKNNVSQGVAFTGLSGEFTPAFSVYGASGKVTANFGQRPFKYTPPTGFLKLNTFNLPDSTIEKGSDHMTPLLYSGNSSTQSITGADFQPALTITKDRNHVTHVTAVDAVRGAPLDLFLSSTNGDSNDHNGITAFTSGGFNLGSSTNHNVTGHSYATHNWKAGTSFSNSAGSNNATIASSGQSDTTAGFSIVSYTGTGSAGTVNHNLTSAPEIIIVKDRARATEWPVMAQHANDGNGHLGYLRFGTYAWGATSILWNNTAPTSSVFSIGTYDYVNFNNSTYIAWCWHSVPGYSSIASYTGNGSTDGPFIYTGFAPQWIMVKVATSQINATNWQVYDTTRNPNNVIPDYHFIDSYAVESNSASTYFNADILSNGFKIRGGNTYGMNQSGAKYIYMAFAENPFKNSNAR
jgi:hypothetical protein